MAFTSTPRGARLARLFVAHYLNSWGHLYDSEVNETLPLITAELCANAVQHGRVPGRDFHVRLAAEAGGGRPAAAPGGLRHPRRTPASPPITAPATPDTESESGRGLLLGDTLTNDWGVTDRPHGPGKTVWAVTDTATARSGRGGARHRRALTGSSGAPPV